MLSPHPSEKQILRHKRDRKWKRNVVGWCAWSWLCSQPCCKVDHCAGVKWLQLLIITTGRKGVRMEGVLGTAPSLPGRADNISLLGLTSGLLLICCQTLPTPPLATLGCDPVNSTCPWSQCPAYADALPSVRCGNPSLYHKCCDLMYSRHGNCR